MIPEANKNPRTGVQEDCQVPGSAKFLNSHSLGLNLPPLIYARCNRALRVWEFAQNGETPTVHLESAGEQA
jgi:hypothetical protein